MLASGKPVLKNLSVDAEQQTWLGILTGAVRAGDRSMLKLSPPTMIRMSGLTWLIRLAASSAASFQSVEVTPEPQVSVIWPPRPSRLKFVGLRVYTKPTQFLVPKLLNFNNYVNKLQLVVYPPRDLGPG